MVARAPTVTGPGTGKPELPDLVPAEMGLGDVVACVRHCTGHGLFLAVDEVQDLFLAASPHAAGLFVEISMLGDLKSGGSVATVISGSTAATRSLCFAKLPPSGSEDFPGYRGVSLAGKYAEVVTAPLGRSVITKMVKRELMAQARRRAGPSLSAAKGDGAALPLPGSDSESGSVDDDIDDDLEECTEVAIMSCGGNGWLVMERVVNLHNKDHPSHAESESRDSDSAAGRELGLHQHGDLLRAVKASILAATPRLTWSDYIHKHLMGAVSPVVWVPVEVVYDRLAPGARAPVKPPTLPAFVREALKWVDAGLLQGRDGAGPGEGLQVTMGSSLQAIEMLRVEEMAGLGGMRRF